MATEQFFIKFQQLSAVIANDIIIIAIAIIWRYLMNITAEKVKKSAIKLFAKLGFEGVSVRDICSDAGVSANALHYHYKSKKNLYQKIIDSFSDKFDVTLAQILKFDCQSSEEYFLRLNIFTETMMQLFIENSNLLKIIYAELSQVFPNSSKNFPSSMLIVAKHITDFIDYGQKQGWVWNEIEPAMVSGLLMDRLANHVQYDEAIAKLFNITIKDKQYRDYWIKKNLEVICYGIFNKGGNL